MLERSIGSEIQVYLERRADFTRRRRKVRIGFDKLYELFAADQSFAKIATAAGVSRVRIRAIYDEHFQELFSVATTERRKARERRRRDDMSRRIAQAIAEDRVLEAITASAARARPKRTIEPILVDRRGDPCKRYRHRAVLVDGKDVETVHHIKNAQVFTKGGLVYGTTSLHRDKLKASRWTIFIVDVPRYRRKVIRCESAKLLKTLFGRTAIRKSVYIPLAGRPENPRYDFLADEGNWKR